MPGLVTRALLGVCVGAFLLAADLSNPMGTHESGYLTRQAELLKQDVSEVMTSARRWHHVQQQQEARWKLLHHPWEHHPIPMLHRPRWRYQIAEILEIEGKTEGAEIGVQRGSFSKDVLRLWTGCTKYILVDVWEQQANYADPANKEDHNALYNHMRGELAPWMDKISILRNWSHDAAKLLNDSSLDFVYIDARHDFEAVLEDLRDWWPKLRVGGIFAGHDFTTANTVKGYALQRDGSRNPTAVRGAVIHFAKEMGIPIHVLMETKNNKKKAPYASWMMRKT